jgi:hypothetical protein
MKKFLKYQCELEGTHENDVTEEMINKLNSDYDKGIGIYNPIFGDCEVGAHVDNNTIVLCGCIIANTKKECRNIYGTLKSVAKSTFKNCKKVSDLLVATGDKLF